MNFFKSSSSSIPVPQAAADDDFAEYAATSSTPAAPIRVSPPTLTSVPFTINTPKSAPKIKGPWYAIWERHSANEFVTEGYIFALLVAVVVMHVWGSRRNRKIVRNFVSAITPVLINEFALVGLSETVYPNTLGETQQEFDVDSAFEPLSHTEYVSYASGRQNIAFMHTTISLQRRNNPIAWLAEYAASFLFDSIRAPADSVTMTIQPFDGSEPGGKSTIGNNSSSKYDNFIWALVNKRQMKRWRDERYDLSLTRTSDWDALPGWLAVMGESKEVGDMCLHKELKEVITECGSFLEFLLITDMPKEKPVVLSETAPKKRIILEFTIPSSSTSPELIQRLMTVFIRIVDHLVASAHFRPEALRKIKATRGEETRKLKRIIDEEGKEERDAKRVEEKKSEREIRLRNMSAAEQKKFLDKEREKERKGLMKRQSRKG